MSLFAYHGIYNNLSHVGGGLMPCSPWISLCTLSPYPDRSSLPLPEEVVVVVSAGCLPVALLLPEDAGRVNGAAVQNGARHPRWKQRVGQRGLYFGMGVPLLGPTLSWLLPHGLRGWKGAGDGHLCCGP